MSLKGNGFCFSGGEIRGFLLRICFFMHQLVLRWFFCFACRYGVTFLRVGETPGYKLILFSKNQYLCSGQRSDPLCSIVVLQFSLFFFYPAWMKFRFVQMRVQTLFQCNNKHVLMIFRIPSPSTDLILGTSIHVCSVIHVAFCSVYTQSG